MNVIGWVLIVVGSGMAAFAAFIGVCLGVYVWAMGEVHAKGGIDLGDGEDEL